MKLITGQAAIDFQTEDIHGNPVSLGDYQGKHLLLSFYRYAACPFCNLRMHQLIKKYAQFEASGLHLLAVFQSPVESILRYVGKQVPPFPMISDPEHKLYHAYGLSGSWAGLAKAGLHPLKFANALAKGYLPGRMEGNITMIPADFLIGPDLVIEKAYYGKDIGDHLPIKSVMRWLKN